MLKEAHYWVEIRGDDSLLNSFSKGLSFSLFHSFICVISDMLLPSSPLGLSPVTQLFVHL